ncbi:major facilitator superfamily domain-containing protein [Scleroderma yunnanense]
MSADRLLGDAEIHPGVEEYGSFTDVDSRDADAVFGGPENRKAVEKRLIRKLDLKLSFLLFISIMNYIDRSNVAAARLKGLEEDLHMTGQQFNTLISIMYIGYVLSQIPSNMFLNQLTRPSVYLSSCIFLWGMFSISIGHYRAVLIFRFFLGFTEAVYYPGILFMISRWYKRDELGLRMAYFSCGNAFSKALGSVIASGVFATMDGKLGVAGWRWLFFIEGGLTCAIAATGFYMIPDFPTTPASWLTSEEQMLAQRRMVEDVHGVEKKRVQKSGLVEALSDWTVWWLAALKAILTVGLSFGNYFPTLAATMGYTPSVTLLLCAPPWILGVASSFIISRHSDVTKDRFLHVAGPVFIGIIGFAIGMSTMNTVARYLSLIFIAQSWVSYIVMLAWVSNSIPDSSSKRAIVIAFVNASTGVANIGASYLWPASWGPSYSKSYVVCILAFSVSITMLWVYRLHLTRLNEKAEMNERSLGLPKGFRYIT